MVRKKTLFATLILIIFASVTVWAGGEQTNFGIGLKAGINRLEGDMVTPAFKPCAYGQLTYNLFEFLAIAAEAGYSKVSDKDKPDFETIIVPYEGQLIFSFNPLGKINPYVVLGGGGFYWNYTQDGQTYRDAYGILRKGYDSFLKSGGGLEIALNPARTFYFNIGATFRQSLTDWLDNLNTGDETDGLLDIHGGFTFYFRTTSRGDRDNDGVPDELDLKLEIKEDPDGYFDHDGAPEDSPPPTVGLGSAIATDPTIDKDPPVVIHSPVRRVEEGRDIRIKADINENQKLKVASILYRPVGFDRWSVGKMMPVSGTLWEGVIPGRSVKEQGLEYCVIAVDEAISGVGYCGLPKLPVRVEVIGNPKMWRVLSGTAALIGWGSSGYYILRKQKN